MTLDPTAERNLSRSDRRWIAFFKLMSWLSTKGRWVRWALGAAFFSGIALCFFSPAIGAIVAFLAVVPLVLFMFGWTALIARDDIRLKRDRAKDRT